MTIFTRNCQPPAVANRGTMLRLWYIREALLAAGWVENSNDGDAAWSSALNLVLSIASGPNGLGVSALAPREVYSPNGDFLPAHVGLVLNMDATNDQNRGLWRISEYIDANTVKVDQAGWFSQGWATESGMAARLVSGGEVVLAGGAWSLLDAPAGSNVQLRLLYVDSSQCYAYVRPRGKLGDPTEINSVNLGGYYAYYMRIQLYFDAPNYMILMSSNSGGTGGLMVGELLDTDPGDTDPIFLLSSASGFDNLPLRAASIRMLDSVLAPINAYAASLKSGTGENIGNAGVDLYSRFGRRLLGGGGLAAARSPWVCLANTASVGACVRGRLPVMRHTYTGFEPFTPFDAAGDWQHLSQGIVIPRNGVGDPLLMWPEI